MMKNALKITLGSLLLLVVGYYSYLYVLPSVTVINHTNKTLIAANVSLPNSHLDFGDIASGQQNTIYYQLKQQDGEYHYNFILSDVSNFTDLTEKPDKNTVLTGRCGYITDNEIHKRVVIELNPSLGIKCSS
ncbi:hypothetical protein [Thalassotalea sp. PLHSN55]|uniref:hypothetical protein n=1 Tax=Thalassotalea sp. PLHSN55 TaxID=3435888 RepID=UPI003F849EEA